MVAELITEYPGMPINDPTRNFLTEEEFGSGCLRSVLRHIGFFGLRRALGSPLLFCWSNGLQFFFQVAPCMTTGHFGNILWRTSGYNGTAPAAAFRSHVY